MTPRYDRRHPTRIATHARCGQPDRHQSGDLACLGAASWVDWDQKHLVAGRFVARAQQDNRVLGWVALSPISARLVFRGVAELSIYIDNSAHGMGLGDALMAKCIEASEAAGLWTLQSGIFPENQASLRLHEKHGFREVGFREKIGQMRDGRWRDIVFMERRSKIVGN